MVVVPGLSSEKEYQETLKEIIRLEKLDPESDEVVHSLHYLKWHAKAYKESKYAHLFSPGDNFNKVLTMEQAQKYLLDLMDFLPPEVAKDFEQNAMPFLEKYGFYDYPASIRHHLNEEGGLFRHSVKVAMNALFLNQLWFRYPEWKVILAALFHDLGKLGNIDFYSGEQFPRYKKCSRFEEAIKNGVPVQDVEKGFISVIGEDRRTYYPFTYGGPPRRDETKASKRVYADMTILDGSLAMKIMNLPADVIQACQFADGHYVTTNDPYKLKCHPLSYLIHWADMYSGIMEEGGWLDLIKEE